MDIFKCSYISLNLCLDVLMVPINQLNGQNTLFFFFCSAHFLLVQAKITTTWFMNEISSIHSQFVMPFFFLIYVHFRVSSKIDT